MRSSKGFQKSRTAHIDFGVLLIKSFPLVLLVFCGDPALSIQEEEPAIIKEVERARLSTVVNIEGEWKKTELFVYSESDKTLQGYALLGAEQYSAVFDLWDGDYTIAVVCNSPYGLEKDALGRFDTLEALCFRLEDEDPQERLASAVGLVSAGNAAVLKPDVLSCCVILEEVNNNMPGYARLEDPRAWLEDVNDEAEILRRVGFRQKETGVSTAPMPLPCDVGMFTQYPDLRLYCFPNDAAEGTATVPRTSFVLEYETGGETVQIRQRLPSLGRGSVVRLGVTVDSASEYEVKCY